MDLILEKDIAFIVSEYPHKVAEFDIINPFSMTSHTGKVSVKNCLEKLNLTQENNKLVSLMALNKVRYKVFLFYFILFFNLFMFLQ